MLTHLHDNNYHAEEAEGRLPSSDLCQDNVLALWWGKFKVFPAGTESTSTLPLMLPQFL